MSKETFAGEPIDPHSLREEIEHLRAELEAVRRYVGARQSEPSGAMDMRMEIKRLRAEVERRRDRIDFLERRLVSEEATVERLTREKDALEALRPHWANGYTSDSVAAQVTAVALIAAEQRVEKLRELLRDARGYVSAYRDSDHHVARAMLARVDAALAETESKSRVPLAGEEEIDDWVNGL